MLTVMKNICITRLNVISLFTTHMVTCCKLAECYGRLNFLPPANEVWGKVIFSETSVILFTGGGRLPTGASASWGRGLPTGRIGQNPHPQNQKSGRYASYWNAFLLSMFTENSYSCYIVIPKYMHEIHTKG